MRKIMNELVNDILKRSELLSIDDISVSEIVDRSIFTSRKGQLIYRDNQVVGMDNKIEKFLETGTMAGRRKNISKQRKIEFELYKKLNEENKLVFQEIFFRSDN